MATAVLSVSTMIMGLAMVGEDNCVVGTDPTNAATAVAYLNMDFLNLGENIIFGNKQNLIWMFWQLVNILGFSFPQT